MGAGEDFEFRRKRLVASLRSEGILKSDLVTASMEKVPRELFVPESLAAYAYDDSPLPIGYGQTISAPHGSLLERGPGETWSP